MLFRALTIVCAASAAISLSGCITGENIGSANCCGEPNAITLDGNPVPGNGNVGDHWHEAWCAEADNGRHIAGTLNYWALNTNSDYPPYETFWCDQLPRAMYMIGKKFDDHILDYDWDDPFVQCCEPACNPPRCSMRYVEPCKRSQSCDPCDSCAPAPAPQPCSSCGSR
jgi:hypothetical protein